MSRQREVLLIALGANNVVPRRLIPGHSSDSVDIWLRCRITLAEVLVKALGARARRFRQRRFSSRFTSERGAPDSPLCTRLLHTLTAHDVDGRNATGTSAGGERTLEKRQTNPSQNIQSWQ